MQEPVDHLDVECDLGSIRLDEVTLRQQAEVRVDLIGADPGNRLRDDGLAGHFLALREPGLDPVAEGEALQRGVEQAAMERILVAVPETGRGAVSVTERVDVKVPQLVGVSDHFGKGS